ncbi:MAG: CBS domain-containing protein [Syntrophobacteraceae bacterium]
MRNVRDILRDKGTAVYSISPDASVYDALRLMAEKNVGSLLVLEGDRMAGMISERDYARKIVLMDKLSRETKVKEIMTTEVLTVTPDTDLDDCMELITDKRVRHLPVVENDRVLGIVSIGDIVKGIIDHKESVIEQLESYIKGHPVKHIT